MGSIKHLSKNALAKKMKQMYSDLIEMRLSLDRLNESEPFDCFGDAKLTIVHKILDDVNVNKCKNCGEHFIPPYRADTTFCEKESPQDQTKSCQEYGMYANYLKKTREDVATKLYKQIYNRKANKVKRIKETGNDLTSRERNSIRNISDFKLRAKTLRAKVKSGEILEEVYVTWLMTEKATNDYSI